MRDSGCRAFTENFRVPLKHLLRRITEEIREVYARCRFCPIPIKLDGRFMERGYGYGSISWALDLKSSTRHSYGRGIFEKKVAVPIPVCAAVKPVENPLDTTCRLPYPIQPFAPGDEAVSFQKIKPDQGPAIRWAWSGSSAPAVLSLWCESGRDHDLVDFVLDGALVESRQVKAAWMNERCFTLRCAVPVKREDLDLSHFKVSATLESDFFEPLRAEVLEILNCLLDRMKLLGWGNLFLAHPFTRAFFGFHCSCFVLASAGLGALPYAGFTHLMIGVSNASIRGAVEKDLRYWRISIRNSS